MKRVTSSISTIVCFGLALALGPLPAAAATRGISVELRASEAPGAPVTETVQLYEKSYALVIGIDRYTRWPRLSNPVKDAKAVAAELEQRGFDVHLETNLNSRALQDTLKEFFALKGAQPEARLLFWFAGHGHTERGEGFLVPADAPPPTDPRFKVKALHMRDFGGLVRLARAKHVLNVFDACFSGTIFRARVGIAPAPITLKTTRPVRQFVTSGEAGQQVRDDGSFRKLFLEALSGRRVADASGDGYLTASELGLFLTNSMSNYTHNRQTPRYGKLRDPEYDRGDFVFALATPGNVPRAPAPAMTAEIVFWETIKDSTNPRMFEAYLEQHPTGAFAALAQAKLAELKGGLIAALTPPAAAVVAVEEMDATYVAVKTANVRAGPSAQSEKVGCLIADTVVSVTGKVEGKQWYRVTHAGSTAYVFAPLLKEVDKAEFMAWERVKASNEAEDFEDFLRAHPEEFLATKNFMLALRSDRTSAVSTPWTPSELAVLKDLATQERENAAEFTAQEQVKASKDAKDLEVFLRAHPGEFAETTRRDMAELLAARAKTSLPAVPTKTEVQPAGGVYPQTYEPGATFKCKRR